MNRTRMILVFCLTALFLVAAVCAHAQPPSHVAKLAQAALHDQGYDCGPVDGVWGMRTINTLKRFQRDKGLDPTGRINPATAEALNIPPPP